MTTRSPIAATRFNLSIDGVQIASFSELQGISTNVNVTPSSRSLQAHELAHVIQQNVNKRGVTVSLRKPDNSDFMSLRRLRKTTGKLIKLSAYNKSGTPLFVISGMANKVDSDQLQQEWSICYETIQRVL